MKVDVYRNLNTKGVTWSIKSRESSNYGKVIQKAGHVLLFDVQFVVQPAGRKRCVSQKRRNVHAFARAEDYIIDTVSEEHRNIIQDCFGSKITVKYNPYICDRFFDNNGIPISHADYVYLSPRGNVCVLNPDGQRTKKTKKTS